MKLLTFLGAGDAYETTYLMPDGREHTAPFCGVALARFFPDSQMRVFVTPEASDKHLPRFLGLVEDYVANVEQVDIGGDRDAGQLWQIFDAVVSHVEPKEQVVFDITHGFRSVAFLSFLASAYLRVIKEIDLVAVLYGNFEARDKTTTPNRAPVIDLTSFVGLLDWMVAADRFVRFGDAHDLAEQLRSARPTYQQIQTDPALQTDAKRLCMAASTLDNVSLALRLIRPNEAMDASSKLQSRLVDAVQSAQTHARPFVPLAQSVADAYAPLSLDTAEQKRKPVDLLARERRMVSWYLERKQYVQAMAVAREWIITWAMLHAGLTSTMELAVREDAEQVLGRATSEMRFKSGAFSDASLASGRNLHSLPKIAQALKLYAEVSQTRNDLLHAGKRKNAGQAKAMEQKIASLCERLNELPLPSTEKTA